MDKEEKVKIAIYNLMALFYECGIKEVHIGGMMRILGVDNETASQHDNEAVILDEDFINYVTELNSPRPQNETLH